MSDGCIHDGSRAHVVVAGSIALTGGAREESGMVAFLYHQESDRRVVALLHGGAGSLDSSQLGTENLLELSLGNSISVEDDVCRLDPVHLVEVEQLSLDYLLQMYNYFLAWILQIPHHIVFESCGIITGCHSRYRGNTGLIRGWMSNIGTEDNRGLAQDPRGLQVRHIVVGPIQLSVELEQDITRSGRVHLEYGLVSKTLCKNANLEFSNLFHLAVGISAIRYDDKDNLDIPLFERLEQSFQVSVVVLEVLSNMDWVTCKL